MGEFPFDGCVKSPIDYWRMFFDESLIRSIIYQSNLYMEQERGPVEESSESSQSSQSSEETESGRNLYEKFNVAEFEQWLGIGMYMSIIKVPRTRYYWHQTIQTSAISETMEMRRWETLKMYLHFNDNAQMPARNDPDYDNIYKIRPFIEILNEIYLWETICVLMK